MPKPTLLVTDAELNMGGSWPAEAADEFELVTAADDAAATLIEAAAAADLIFTCYAPITAEVIAAAPRLRGIVKYGVGTDSIDLQAAAERGIPVVHCPDYGTDTVADQAFGLMLAAARQIPKVDSDLKQQGWLWPEAPYLGTDLAGKTLGIVGFGRIGKAMACRGGGFGMQRLVCDPYVPHDAQEWGNLQFASLERVLAEADFLSLHCVLTPETKGLLSAENLRRLKPTAIVVNVSRGELIDQQALVEALQQGRLAGAGLDVFAQEPLDAEHPLHSLGNVVLSPHFAFYTREAYERLEAECLGKVRDLIAERVPPHVKNAAELHKHGHTRWLEECSGPNERLPPGEPAEQVAQDWKLTEGDVNLSPARQEWREQNVSESSRELLARDDRAFLHQSLSTPCLTALVGCEGSYLIDERGKKYLDFHGNSAHQVGFRNAHVLRAVTQQLETLPFCPRRFTNEPAVQLAEKLAELAPGNLEKVLLAPGGTSAIGIAMKLARYATGRHKTISMWDSFHGASLDAISIGGEPLFRDGLGPLLPGCFHVPWPHEMGDAEQIEKILVEQGDIGAVIAEPMRCTTLEAPPASYWRQVRKLCDKHGVLLVFDEIPTALGRTGRMFCCENFEVVPDILVIGKGLGGGVFPIAAVIARRGLEVATDRALGHYTHEKSPVGAAAALATIEVIEHENLLERANELGRTTTGRLRQLQEQHPIVSDVRGMGLALAVELSVGGEPALRQAERVLYSCLAAGLSFKISDGNVLTLTPPLTISDAEMDQALDILTQAIQAVSGE